MRGRRVEYNLLYGDSASALPQAIAAWNFDEASGDVVDRTGNGHDFALGGNVVRSADGLGNPSRALTLSASQSESVGPTIFGQSADRTLVLDVWRSALAIGWAFEMKVTSIGSGAWGLLFLNNEVNIQARNAGGLARANFAETIDSEWYTVIGRYVESADELGIWYYHNGVLTLGETVTLAGPLRTDADNLHAFDGLGSETRIDNVRMFDFALTEAQMELVAQTPVS